MTKLQQVLIINRTISSVGVEANVVIIIVIFTVIVLGVNTPLYQGCPNSATVLLS